MRKCPICNGELQVSEHEKEAYIGDKLVGHYTEKHLMCKNCYARVFDRALEEENRQSRNEFWRKYYNLISLEDIKKLPRRLKATREVISKALKISNKGPLDNLTVWDGELPTKEESERMEKALNNVNYFLYCAKQNGVDEQTLAEVKTRHEK